LTDGNRELRSTKYQVPRTKYQVPSTKYQVPSIFRRNAASKLAG
jgi:hypothetical protein